MNRQSFAILIVISVLLTQNLTARTPINNVTPSITGSYLTIQEPNGLVDSVFLQLCKYIRSEGYQLVEKQKRYPFKRDTLYFNRYDSILIYKYNKDDFVEFYYKPFDLGSLRNLGWPGEDTMVIKVNNLIDYLKRATLCYGIAYGWGDCFVDVWSFNGRLAAAAACDLYNETELYVFPKTWNFAINVSNKLYVFHGRYSRVSYESKKHFEYFVRDILKRDLTY